MESGGGLHHSLARLHKLLCNAHGGQAGRDGHAEISRIDKKIW